MNLGWVYFPVPLVLFGFEGLWNDTNLEEKSKSWGQIGNPRRRIFMKNWTESSRFIISFRCAFISFINVKKVVSPSFPSHPCTQRSKTRQCSSVTWAGVELSGVKFCKYFAKSESFFFSLLLLSLSEHKDRDLVVDVMLGRVGYSFLF